MTVTPVAPATPVTTAALGARLREVLPVNRVDTSSIALTVNARDAGFYEYRPRAVVRVASEEEVRGLLRAARDLRLPVTFRAGGTSLSGQSVGEGIIADVSTAFLGVEVLDAGARVKAEPGPTAEMVNRVLSRYGRRIGPDPASIRAGAHRRHHRQQLERDHHGRQVERLPHDGLDSVRPSGRVRLGHRGRR